MMFRNGCDCRKQQNRARQVNYEKALNLGSNHILRFNDLGWRLDKSWLSKDIMKKDN